MALRKKRILSEKNVFIMQNVSLRKTESTSSNYKYSFSFKREERQSSIDHLCKNIEILIDKIK